MADFGGNMALNIEQRLGQKLTNEQQIMWNYVLQRWPNATITPIFLYGLVGELGIYSATKMYVCYQLGIPSGTTAQAIVTTQMAALYDETNVVFGYLGFILPYWDATAAAPRYNISTNEYHNLIFSRIVVAVGLIQSFVGYRINF